jgi:hypothetical protein
MSRLLALYPAAWRARYGEEFAELLEMRPPNLRDRLDIVLGAVDARINPQVPGADDRERSVAGDRVARVVAILAGVLFTVWGVVGATSMVPWDSGLDPRGSPELLNLAWMAGSLGSLLTAVAFGIIMSALGMGMLGLLAIAIGVILFSWRANGRLLSTVVAFAFAAGSLFVVAGFLVFVAGGGQDVNVLLPMVGLGPSWIAFGLGLRQPRSMPDSSSSSTASLASA